MEPNSVGHFYVFPATFKNEVCAGLDYKMICRELQRQGLLLHDHGGFTKNVRVRGDEGGSKPTKMYVVRDTIVPSIANERPAAPAPVQLTALDTETCSF